MTKGQVMAALHVHDDLGLLEHLPARYEDLTPTLQKPLDRYEDRERVVILAVIEKVQTVLKAHMIRFIAKGIPSRVSYPCLVFGQMFLTSKIASGKFAVLVGRYAKRFHAVLVSAVYDKDSRFVKAKLKPIYKLPKDVSQSSFSFAISNILTQDNELLITDKVPSAFVKKYRLLPRLKAFSDVHEPDNVKDLTQGMRNFKYEECLAYCLKIVANKRVLSLRKKAQQKPIDKKAINALVASLPFKLTHDQIVAVQEIVNDMDSPAIMFRLLQGDVSTGKTIVALIALYANALRGGQGVLLAPTQALASQHYANAVSLLKGTKAHIGFLVSKMANDDRKRILNGVSDGSIDILIATQAGLTDRIHYRNLSLAVIDEQQSFGVNQRAALIGKGDAVDTLMMTATPIPRTIAKISNGDMSLSELHQFPSGTVRDVKTVVSRSDDPFIPKAINKALAAHRQVFIVVPRIEESALSEGSESVSAKEVYREYAKTYGADKTQLLYGKMKAEDQARIIQDFANGSKPILIATSVIEVGMDIKKAGLMIIYAANMFGLSALHQLRGRIGRNGAFALAVLVYDGDDPKAKAKLDFLAKTNDGFAISQFDYQSRGSGSLEGTNQSGMSDLMIADFVNDQNIFECAMKDANEILDNLKTNSEYRQYAESILGNDPVKDSILA